MSDYLLPDGTVPVLVSSESADLLVTEAASLLAYVEAHPDVTPQSIASMLFRTRVARKYRALAAVTNRDELISALRAIQAREPHPSVVTSTGAATARRTAFVFPGQGSQRPGMGNLFYELSPAFRAEVDKCHDVFMELYGTSPRSYVLHKEGQADENVRVVQPALFMQMVGLADRKSVV